MNRQFLYPDSSRENRKKCTKSSQIKIFIDPFRIIPFLFIFQNFGTVYKTIIVTILQKTSFPIRQYYDPQIQNSRSQNQSRNWTLQIFYKSDRTFHRKKKKKYQRPMRKFDSKKKSYSWTLPTYFHATYYPGYPVTGNREEKCIDNKKRRERASLLLPSLPFRVILKGFTLVSDHPC